MLFIIKFTLKLACLLLFLSFLLEASLRLIEAQPQDLSAAGILLSEVVSSSYSHIAQLQLRSLALFRWASWVFLNKVYYLLLVLVVLVAYYNYRNKSLKQPPILQSKRISSDNYQRAKQEETKRALDDLRNQPAYKQYRRKLLLGQIKDMADDETAAELRSKEQEIF